MIRESSLGLCLVALAFASGCTCHGRHLDKAPVVAARVEKPRPPVAPVEVSVEVAEIDPAMAALELEFPPATPGPIIIKGEPADDSAREEAAQAHHAWIGALSRGAKDSQGKWHGRPFKVETEESLLAADARKPAPAGPHMRLLGNPHQDIAIYQGPGVTPIAQVEQGAPCEILGSCFHAGTRWFRVQVHGVDGWTPLVDSF